ncbi:hypothetical protein CEP54_012546 [Fusarium duplospermum]|uniref:Amidohydrolase 3 domain-containing protein n=1 Tax=Fusarium duplospermum TaxID=1325734 RepID=A0A428P7Z4_9HYPO|nr:hypothetical protein CEP54_012546 [Fusarium duplospermum]
MAATSSSPGTLLVNGRIFTKGGSGLEGQAEFADSMFVQDSIIKSIGPRDELSAKHQHESTHTQNLDGKTVLPGFVDGHIHLLQLGQSLQKLVICQILKEARFTAINVLETHTKPGSRHRIEHLEFSAPEDAKRLGSLGITASIQPVHADPMILVDWPRLIGTHRCKRAFAYRDFADFGALLAIGSDTPTAPWDPLKNLYVATTRRSARQPEWTTTVNENFRLGLCEAVTAATLGAAKSVFAEERVGSLEVGKAADFAGLNLEWDAEKLLGASVEETWFNGKRVYQNVNTKL